MKKTIENRLNAIERQLSQQFEWLSRDAQDAQKFNSQLHRVEQDIERIKQLMNEKETLSTVLNIATHGTDY
ncbi:MAG: hypothetical protein ACRCZB_06070 [Bacteroidales bacterium]